MVFKNKNVGGAILSGIISLLLSMQFSPVFALTAVDNNSIPIPTGPYLVGYEKYDLNDPSHQEIDYPDGRLIPIRIYFPMNKGVHKAQKKELETRFPDTPWDPLTANVFSKHTSIAFINKEFEFPLIILNHGNDVAMTDYSFIIEDLASHGYVVVAIQHQLKTDYKAPKYLKERDISRYGQVIDNMYFVYSWLKNEAPLPLKSSINMQQVGLIGHSMGGNALLALLNRVSNSFQGKNVQLFPHNGNSKVKEAVIVLDVGGFSYPSHHLTPLLLLLSEEREAYQKKSDSYQDMLKIGHNILYYKGSKHISFMDHGYVNPINQQDPKQTYVNGTEIEKKHFFDKVRQDILDFLAKNGISPTIK